MGETAKPDFSGWATKVGLKCTDGRTIMKGAFEHQDGVTVPLVWSHKHDSPENVLGHVKLTHVDEGVRCDAFFNNTPKAQSAKAAVVHKDITALSIWANQLIEKSKQVLHGAIKEVSLVLGGANPGALIDYIQVQHSDGEIVELEGEALIYTGLPLLIHSDGSSEELEDKTDDKEVSEETKAEHDSVSPEVAKLVDEKVKEALSEKQEEGDKKEEVVHEDHEKEGRSMSRNVFEQHGDGQKEEAEKHVLTHDALRGIVEDAKSVGSLRKAYENYVIKHGIEDIEVLFPEARTVGGTPDLDTRRVEWVSGVLNGTKKAPFARIRTRSADLTHEEARAKGYIKGNMKKEEFFKVQARKTTPATVYKKQKLDRDDIVDITDYDVVAWLKAEMRMMLDEEIARAILIGDGRAADDEDKVKDPAGSTEGEGIRSILNDDDLYAATVTVDDSADPIETVDAIVGELPLYKGSGSPTLYTTQVQLTKFMLKRDSFGHRVWRTPAELAAELGVSNIVTVEAMESEPDLIGIVVNLNDYTVGTDQGGEVNFFDQFDIDYNQYKYLYETRLSGALTKIRSALVLMRAATGTAAATPTAPTFNTTTNVVTIPTVTGVVYKDKSDDSTLSAGAQPALGAGESLTVEAQPDTGYYFVENVHDEWTFDSTA
jgi:hypothetical protein